MEPMQHGAPPGGPPQGWGQPPSPAQMPPPPPKKSSNTLLWVILGGVALVVFGIPCLVMVLAGAGGFFAYRGARERVAESQEAFETAQQARRERVEQLQPAQAAASGPADPADAPFAAFVLDATRAIESAARGQPHDARWNGRSPADDLRTVRPETGVALAPLGSWTVAATALEVEAIGPSPGGSAYVRSNVLVFPDGRVRWLSVSARIQPQVYVHSTPEVATLAPPLARFTERMIGALRSPGCALPVASPQDLAGFPGGLQREARAASTRTLACQVVQNAGATTVWQPRYDDVTVVVTGNGQWVTLRSSFEVEQGRLILNAVRGRSVQ